MTDRDRELLANALERARLEPAAGSDPDELLAYLEGTLEPEARARVEQAAAADPEVAAALVDLEDFRQAGAAPEASADEPADFERAAVWKAVTREVHERERPVAAPTPGRWQALAAILATAALGLGLWGIEQSQTVAELEGRLATPQVQVPIAYLDQVSRSMAPEVELAVGAGLERILLIVDPGEEGEGPYSLTLTHPDGASAWQGTSLVPSEEGALRILVPAAEMPGGLYRVEVQAADGRVTATYSLRVQTSEP